MKPYLYIAGMITVILALYFYGESKEEDGYNKAIAEQQELVAAWKKQQREAYEADLKKVRAREQQLQSDLSTLQGDFNALQSEVSSVPLTKPKPDVQGVPDCSDYNPFSDNVARVFNLGARGAIGAAKAAADTGDGEVSEPAGGSTR